MLWLAVQLRQWPPALPVQALTPPPVSAAPPAPPARPAPSSPGVLASALAADAAASRAAAAPPADGWLAGEVGLPHGPCLPPEAAWLQAAAHVALGFSPSVSLVPPQGVLLEVQASLRYFGGLVRLCQRLREALAGLGPVGQGIWLASAPTAQGAVWLSQLGDGLHCRHADQLVRWLDAAPVGLLACAAQHGPMLCNMGLHRLGQLRQLPRAGLARRFGEGLLAELDRALGRQADPRAWVSLPAVFDAGLELPERADHSDQLLLGGQLLLQQLLAWAAARQVLVQRFTLWLVHEVRRHRRQDDVAATPLRLALAQPSRDAGHLGGLLREHLGRLPLPAPARALRLHCQDVLAAELPSGDLFPHARSEQQGLVQLVERLQARLGPTQVQRLVRVADHRPERATQVLPAEGARLLADGLASGRSRSAPPAAPVGDRGLAQPVWLLPRPERLAEQASRPMLQGQPLQLLSGPDRLEAGWWDGGLAERDYFIAQAGDGALVWIYRSRLPHPTLPEAAGQDTGAPDGGWFLHGRFA